MFIYTHFLHFSMSTYIYMFITFHTNHNTYYTDYMFYLVVLVFGESRVDWWHLVVTWRSWRLVNNSTSVVLHEFQHWQAVYLIIYLHMDLAKTLVLRCGIDIYFCPIVSSFLRTSIYFSGYKPLKRWFLLGHE